METASRTPAMSAGTHSLLKVTRIYMLLPLIVMIAFIVYYRTWDQAEHAARQQRLAQEQVEEQQAAAKRKAMEDQMAVESQHLRELREQAQQEKDKKENDERENRIAELQHDLAISTGQLENTGKDLAETSAALEKTRADRFAAEKEVFDRSVAVEKLRVDKNQADLEYQRLNDMVLDIVVAAPMP